MNYLLVPSFEDYDFPLLQKRNNPIFTCSFGSKEKGAAPFPGGALYGRGQDQLLLACFRHCSCLSVGVAFDIQAFSLSASWSVLPFFALLMPETQGEKNGVAESAEGPTPRSRPQVAPAV